MIPYLASTRPHLAPSTLRAFQVRRQSAEDPAWKTPHCSLLASSRAFCSAHVATRLGASIHSIEGALTSQPTTPHRHPSPRSASRPSSSREAPDSSILEAAHPNGGTFIPLQTVERGKRELGPRASLPRARDPSHVAGPESVFSPERPKNQHISKYVGTKTGHWAVQHLFEENRIKIHQRNYT